MFFDDTPPLEPSLDIWLLFCASVSGPAVTILYHIFTYIYSHVTYCLLTSRSSHACLLCHKKIAPIGVVREQVTLMSKINMLKHVPGVGARYGVIFDQIDGAR